MATDVETDTKTDIKTYGVKDLIETALKSGDGQFTLSLPDMTCDIVRFVGLDGSGVYRLHFNKGIEKFIYLEKADDIDGAIEQLTIAVNQWAAQSWSDDSEW